MRLKDKYNKEVLPKLAENLSQKNRLALQRLEKVVINIGASRALQDSSYFDVMEKTLERITGQKPVKTKAKKSISGFKIRAGMVVGFKVTLRGERMWDFLDKLINVTFPRVRDFRGLSKKGFDRSGNYAIGFRECIAFPEIRSDEIEKTHGLEVVIGTTAKTADESYELLSALGFPFKKEEK